MIGTNGYTYLGYEGVATMTVSSGTWMARDVYVGTDDSEGTLTFLGGITTISSNLTLGDCGAGSLGHLFLKDGYLFITNAAHNATLDVRNDVVLITGGHLIVDRVVMTNDCGLFIHAGGTVSVGSELLDPNLDADNDGLPNGWEIAHGLDPLDSSGVNGADGDPDGDGYSNMQEYLARLRSAKSFVHSAESRRHFRLHFNRARGKRYHPNVEYRRRNNQPGPGFLRQRRWQLLH